MFEDLNLVFSEDSMLSGAIKGFEHRGQQLSMAEKVAEALSSEKHLLVEAGCGTGKSLAYLAPMLSWSKRHDKKVIISTYTKNLQQQLVNKDLPLLLKSSKEDFRFEICMGSSNYICLRRFRQVAEDSLFSGTSEQTDHEKIAALLEAGHSGLIPEMDFIPNMSLISDITRRTDLCFFSRCSHFRSCCYFKAYARQCKADLLVSNHHLLISDIISDNAIIPAYHAAVIDEAHNLEDSLSDCLSPSVSRENLIYYLRRISGYKRSLLNRQKSLSKEESKTIRKMSEHTREAIEDFFLDIQNRFGREETTKRLRSALSDRHFAVKSLEECARVLEEYSEKIKSPSLKIEFIHNSHNIKDYAQMFRFITEVSDRDFVYSLRNQKKKKEIKTELKAEPVDVSGFLKSSLLEKCSTVVFCSATLMPAADPGFIQKRLGLMEIETALFDSPYDYKKQVLLYIPDDIRNPKDSSELYMDDITERISDILSITGGKTFILFTSYKLMNSTVFELCGRFPQLRFLVQGEMSRKKIIDDFISSSSSVIAGTSAFWQGVDFPGRLLECVIITKLPFSVPDEPVIQARMERISSLGANPFYTYLLPKAALLLKQGFGRLIRHREDRGIVAILDSRLKTMKYGKSFLDSLPECSDISDINELEDSYKNLFFGH